MNASERHMIQARMVDLWGEFAPHTWEEWNRKLQNLSPRVAGKALSICYEEQLGNTRPTLKRFVDAYGRARKEVAESTDRIDPRVVSWALSPLPVLHEGAILVWLENGAPKALSGREVNALKMAKRELDDEHAGKLSELIEQARALRETQRVRAEKGLTTPEYVKFAAAQPEGSEHRRALEKLKKLDWFKRGERKRMKPHDTPKHVGDVPF